MSIVCQELGAVSAHGLDGKESKNMDRHNVGSRKAEEGEKREEKGTYV